MEAINDSSKYVTQAHKLIEEYLEKNDIDEEALLLAARDLLAKTIEILVKAI